MELSSDGMDGIATVQLSVGHYSAPNNNNRNNNRKPLERNGETASRLRQKRE
jgi:hypothetical protein